MFEWYVTWSGSKVRHKKYTCLEKIGLGAQNMLIILGWMVNMIVGTYMSPKWARESSLKIFIRAPKIVWFGFANDLALNACFISYQKWVHWEKCHITHVHLTRCRCEILQQWVVGWGLEAMCFSCGISLIGFCSSCIRIITDGVW